MQTSSCRSVWNRWLEPWLLCLSSIVGNFNVLLSRHTHLLMGKNTCKIQLEVMSASMFALNPLTIRQNYQLFIFCISVRC